MNLVSIELKSFQILPCIEMFETLESCVWNHRIVGLKRFVDDGTSLEGRKEGRKAGEDELTGIRRRSKTRRGGVSVSWWSGTCDGSSVIICSFTIGAGIEGRTPLAPSLLAPCYPEPASPPVQEIASSRLASPPPSSFASFFLSFFPRRYAWRSPQRDEDLLSPFSILRSNNIRVSCVVILAYTYYVYFPYLADLFSRIIYIYIYFD